MEKNETSDLARPAPTVLVAKFTFPNDVVSQDGTVVPSADQLQTALQSPNVQTLDSTIATAYSVEVCQKE